MFNLHFLPFFVPIQAAQVEAWLHPTGVWFWNWNEKVSTVVLYGVEYDTRRQTLPFAWFNSKRSQTPLVWCWIWLREASIAIFHDDQYDSKRQTLPFCVKLRLIQRQTLSYCIMALVMTQRGKLCHVVRWIWNKEANAVVLCYVEYDREANCNGSVWRDDEKDTQV